MQQSEFADDDDQVDIGDRGNGNLSAVVINDDQPSSEQLAGVTK